MELQGKAKGPVGKTGSLSRGSRDKHVLLKVGLGKSGRLILAGLLFSASTWWALTRFSRPDPFRKPVFLSWAWWTHPLEVNAPARLPVVSGTLTSIAVTEDGAGAYVAGQQGLLLRYKASSQEWERLAVPDSLGYYTVSQALPASGPHPTAASAKSRRGNVEVLEPGGNRAGREHAE